MISHVCLLRTIQTCEIVLSAMGTFWVILQYLRHGCEKLNHNLHIQYICILKLDILKFWIFDLDIKKTCLVNFIDGLIEKSGKVCVGCVSDTTLVFLQ